MDERGSKDQKIIYQYLKELYPAYEIIYEFQLYEIKQRIDIFIPYLGIAVEYNGRQHYEYVEHFHRDMNGFNLSKFLDNKKQEYLYEKGIKIIYIPYNEMVNSKEELQTLIEKTPYPDFEYTLLEEININKKQELKKQSQQRKDYRKKMKKELNDRVFSKTQSEEK